MVKQRKYTGSVAGSNPVLSKHFSVAVPKKVIFDFVTNIINIRDIMRKTTKILILAGSSVQFQF